jgi:Ca-activated chloride channel family protein
MAFASPHALIWLALLPVVALVDWWLTRRDRARAARVVARSLWPRVVRRDAEAWRRLRVALVLVAAAGLILALARPRWGIVREKIEREGVDVVLVIDTSGSMATEDVAPNRLFLARSALASLVARLAGDRFALVAFEGEAYPLAPLTLDADAIGLFLETLEPGTVPLPGTSLGQGLERGLDLFVDKERRNKVMVLVSDGEDLEGEVEAAVRRAKEAGVVIHTVGVGTEQGQPVPQYDREGERAGFKKDEKGSVVVSRLNMATLEAVARQTGGRAFRITPQDASLGALAAAIEGVEEKSLTREYAYRLKERFQWPLGMGLGALALALLLPPPRGRRARAARASSSAGQVAAALGALLVALSLPGQARAAGATDEVLLRPRRLTARARAEYDRGGHPEALKLFEAASGLRPNDPRARFNLAAALYKNGRNDEAEALFRALGDDPRSGLAGAARYNLGNTLYQKQDFRGAIQAYRDALTVAPEDADTRRNLELALRALKAQQAQQQRQEKNQGGDQQQKKDQGGDRQKQPQGQRRPQSEEQKERERFQREAGMPKERAMQLLEALQRNEKDEQRKALAAQRVEKKGGKDW